MIDWELVAEKIENIIVADEKRPPPPKDGERNPKVAYQHLDVGQCKSLRDIAQRLNHNGIIIADDVGMGKTRIATTLTKAVTEAGGRVAILVPPGLGFQWGDELAKSQVQDVPEILRSLDAYLNSWAGDNPWANHKVLIVSHAFCNWQVKSNPKKNWKWSLLPQTLALVQAQLRESGRVPRGTKNHEKFDDERVKAAANWVAEKSNRKTIELLAQKEEFSQWGDRSPLLNPENYRKHTEYRKGLECVIGLGLGVFDLIVIDEAHKSRGAESNLERLLANVVSSSANARRLALTATPIELDVKQWEQMLDRIGVLGSQAKTAIQDYAAAVHQVRRLPNDELANKAFANAAKDFQSTLDPYLLRRDKREVKSVKAFVERGNKEHSDYRRLSDIAVQTAALSPAWKQAVCAAEALSFVTRGLNDQTAKRIRLTFGGGHGIATLMDKTLRNEFDDAADDITPEPISLNLDDKQKKDKRAKRVEWWKNVMSQAFKGNEDQKAGEVALYAHPAILAAVAAIEAVCEQGEKVLVFGRFTRPMQALVRLLNAREMLRCLYKWNRHWPQEVLRKDDQVNEDEAVSAALLQLEIGKTLENVKALLKKQYGELEKQRDAFRSNLEARIRDGLMQAHLKDKTRTEGLFKAFSEVLDVPVEVSDPKITPRVLVARAIQETLSPEDLEKPTSIALAFESIITAASDTDEGDVDGDGQLNPTEAGKMWSTLMVRLKGEFGRQEGSFARLMNGNTKPHTRRLLQLAFNREHANPKVLVAQSMVGREGLNLHEACRTVILLHAEWNPGVVEQQIGRVDRINSLWEKKLANALAQNFPADALPKIEIRPVIFQGTYDEHNWMVLRQRWDDLRAQLHGVVITPSIAENLSPEVVRSINACAPNFSPLRLQTQSLNP